MPRVRLTLVHSRGHDAHVRAAVVRETRPWVAEYTAHSSTTASESDKIFGARGIAFIQQVDSIYGPPRRLPASIVHGNGSADASLRRVLRDRREVDRFLQKVVRAQAKRRLTIGIIGVRGEYEHHGVR